MGINLSLASVRFAQGATASVLELCVHFLNVLFLPDFLQLSHWHDETTWQRESMRDTLCKPERPHPRAADILVQNPLNVKVVICGCHH